MEFLLHHKLKMIESKLKFKIKYFIEFCVYETFMTALYRSSLKLSTDWVVADTQYYVALPGLPQLDLSFWYSSVLVSTAACFCI